MDHAARRLADSDAGIERIAQECGIENLGHFHRLFRAHHGTTPGRWRARRRGETIRPGHPDDR